MQPQFITLPPQAIDITGQTFERFTVLGPIERRNRKIMWLCQCECGNTATVARHDLIMGKSRSCGCLKRETTSQIMTTHGKTKTPLYQVWHAIIKRCTNPKAKDYPRYGGRGIIICDEWKESFQVFYDHVANLPDYEKKGYSLDRIDNALGYFPGNVRWASLETQARNSRNAHQLTYNGKTQCIREWARETGINEWVISQRVTDMGWSVERTLTTPVQERRKPAHESYPRQKH